MSNGHKYLGHGPLLQVPKVQHSAPKCFSKQKSGTRKTNRAILAGAASTWARLSNLIKTERSEQEQQGCAALNKNPAGSATQRKTTYFRDHATPIRVLSTTALAHASPNHQVHRAPTYTSALSHVLTRAQRTRVHFCPQHWLLCHLGLY